MLSHETAGAWYGSFDLNSLGTYNITVSADIPDATVEMIEDVATWWNPLALESVDEIGIVSVAAAVANTVQHATGLRIRMDEVTDLLRVQAARTGNA